MIKTPRFILVTALAVFMCTMTGAIPALAGTKDLEATKRDKYDEKGTESLIEVMNRKDAEEKEFRQTLIENTDTIIDLLKEIKKQLILSNTKTGK